MKKIKLIFVVLFTSILLVGCNSTASENTDTTDTTSDTTSYTFEFKDSDEYFDWTTQDYTTINVATDSTIITSGGTYVLEGESADGTVTINTTEKVYLVLNNVTINSVNSAPIYVEEADKVVILLPEGTTNTLTQSANVTVDADGDPKGAIFSKGDLTITGTGTLNVISEFADGINSRDNLVITGGNINVTAVGDGIIGKDIVAAKNATITVNADEDGLKATNTEDSGRGIVYLYEGTYTINSVNDAISATQGLEISGGNYILTTNGGFETVNTTNDTNPFGGMGGNGQENATAEETSDTTPSAKALKSDTYITIINGAFGISSTDDAIHCATTLTISGGTFNIETEDDAIHSDADIMLNDGQFNISNSYEGIEGTAITINGGSFTMTSSDDAFNVNDTGGTLTFNGGSMIISAAGDGLDSNGTIVMNGGEIYLSGPIDAANSALDYEGSFEMNGGTLVASGSSGMAQSPSGGEQPSILMTYGSTQSAGTAIILKNSSGTEVINYAPTKDYTSVALSSLGLTIGETYTLYAGDTELGEFTIENTNTYISNASSNYGGATQGGGGTPPGDVTGGDRGATAPTNQASPNQDNSTSSANEV